MMLREGARRMLRPSDGCDFGSEQVATAVVEHLRPLLADAPLPADATVSVRSNASGTRIPSVWV
jgi:hypothetical protein